MNIRVTGLVAPALSIVGAGACCFPALAGGGPVSAFGLQHAPIGQAQLDPQGSRLVVSNIGSSGKDGVSIDLGETQGFHCEADFGQRGQLPPGMLFRFDATAQFPGGDLNLYCFQLEEVGNGLGGLSMDLSALNPGMLRVEAVLDGQVQETYEFGQPFPNPILVGDLGTTPDGKGSTLTVSNIGSSGKDGVAAGCTFCIDSFFDIHYQTPFQGSVGGNPVVIADAVRFTLLQMPAGSLPLPPFTRAEMHGAVPGSLYQFGVNEEAIELFDLPHRALGQAQMSAGGDHLTISNIGSSGKDGVSQDPLPPGSQGNNYEFSGIAPPDAFLLTVESDVLLEGLPPGEPVVRTVELPPGMAFFEMTVDFSALGSSSQTVELYLGGPLVFTQSGQTGVVATATTFPDFSGLESVDGGVIQKFGWVPAVPVTIPGGPTILADQLVVIPEPGGGLGLPAFQEMTASRVWVAGDDSIDIVNQQALLPPACPWDCQAVPDGNVSVTDFLTMLSQWGQAGTSCEFDGGVVSVTDFLVMLAHWGPCP
jgi:hypothetical protein